MIITLLSDMGTNDTGMVAARATFLQHFPEAVVVDISHTVAAYDVHQAAYILQAAYRHFARGAVHLVAVDIASGNPPRLVLAEQDGYYFIAPDNGVLPLALGNGVVNTRLCFEPTGPLNFADWLRSVVGIIKSIEQDNTFRFRPIAVKEAAAVLRPGAQPNYADCNIRYIDRYGNIVLDISRQQFEELVGDRPFRIQVMKERKEIRLPEAEQLPGMSKIKLVQPQDVTTISYNYNDVEEGEPLCRFNDAGFLEVAVNRTSAAALLAIGRSSGSLLYQTIKIFF